MASKAQTLVPLKDNRDYLTARRAVAVAKQQVIQAQAEVSRIEREGERGGFVRLFGTPSATSAANALAHAQAALAEARETRARVRQEHIDEARPVITKRNVELVERAQRLVEELAQVALQDRVLRKEVVGVLGVRPGQGTSDGIRLTALPELRAVLRKYDIEAARHAKRGRSRMPRRQHVGRLVRWIENGVEVARNIVAADGLQPVPTGGRHDR